ncbi:MAG: hypothetical protein IJV80_00585, partial [Clostridia bacterium]|nr:hypothetical protein [Clostridia bacterium]
MHSNGANGYRADLGAAKSFILTDGSTCGVFAMLYAAKRLGVKTVALPEKSHQSAYNACQVLGLKTVRICCKEFESGRFCPPEQEAVLTALFRADALLLTSPTYYGDLVDLEPILKACEAQNKLLLVDGAHGGHLHFNRATYAGEYAHFWVDGVHKSLPAFTQGAVVSAKKEEHVHALEEGVCKFRTTSPSYPIMASVEYAVKYPQNEWLEREVRAFAKEREKSVCVRGDYTKLFVAFKNVKEAVSRLEKKRIYAEFFDGESVCFYLSPAMEEKQFLRLKKELVSLSGEFGVFSKISKKQCPAPKKTPFLSKKTVWMALEKAQGRICAEDCGLFPPCVPVLIKGEKVTEEKIRLLQGKTNVFGLQDGKISV